MNVERLIYLIAALLLMGPVASVFGDNSEGPASPLDNELAICLNNLPWNAYRVSLRWWKNESVGRYFEIQGIGGRFSSWEGVLDLDIMLYIDDLSYGWLWRKEFSLIENSFIL